MKTVYKSLFAAALTAPLLTGCIEEAIPTNAIIQTQLESSPKATEALVWAMPGHLNVIATLSQQYHFDFGWPSLMHIRDVMTEDMYVRDAGGYNWFSTWSSNNTGLGPNYLVCQYPWNYFYAHILTTNKAVSAVDPATEDPTLQLYLGAAYANRALTYLDAARMYEFLPTEFYPKGVIGEGEGAVTILGLSMPIVDETTTEEQMRNNPRATHEQMIAFIKGDLEKAIDLLGKGASSSDKTLPSLEVAYGLMARLHLWDASYQEEVGDPALATTAYSEAAKYARLAINTGGHTPLTQDQWLSTTSGFNDSSFSSWMLAGQYVTEDDAVQAGAIRTWTSFMSPEQTFGYAAPAQGAFPEIGASLYDKISDRDFRKLTFTPVEGSPLADRIPYIDKTFAEENFDSPYIAIKFRPGGGNMYDGTVGAVVAYPLMRVEEMYLIEAEAVAHSNPAEGLKLLQNFMTTYRYANYKSNASGVNEVVQEIILQKRIELWGEGQSFFDVKRLNMSVTRYYGGTNFEPGLDTFNTNGRPAWMNFCITNQEIDNNQALKGFNSPTPAGLYDAIKQ